MFERSQYMTGYYPSKDIQGDDILLVVVKRTYSIDLVEAKCRVADKQDEINLADVYNGDEDPFKSSVKYESDLAPWKTKKDIVFVGKAYAPGGKPQKTFDVTLQVGPHKRSLRIFGPRKAQWVPPVERKRKGSEKETGTGPLVEHQPPIIGEPEPIDEVELIYENAYGGFATYYPDDPKLHRKAIRKERKKKKEKEEEKKKKEEAKEEAKAKAGKKKEEEAAAKKKAEEKKSFFFDGIKDVADAPDDELEVEIGSRKLKAEGGTMVLDLAELAEAEEREELEAAARDEAAANAAAAERALKDGARVADPDDLAALAAELSEDAEAEREAFEAQLAAETDRERESARSIDQADLGDEVTADDSWIDQGKREREAFYESLGLDPNTEVAWEEGEFPRFPCPTNFVGKGFALRNCEESLQDLELPLIEDPNALLKPEDLPIDPATMHLPVIPKPAGFGVVSRAWSPRVYLAGLLPPEIEEAQFNMDKQLVDELDPENEEDQATIDALMNREAKPMQPEYYNAAPASLQVDHLDGDEDVFLKNLDASGNTFFKLADSRPYVRMDRGEGWELVDVTLDTMVIDREEEKVLLLWRGTVGYGGIEELAEYPRLDIDIQDMGMIEWRDNLHREQIEAARRKGKALRLGVDEIDEAEAAEFDSRIEKAGVGLHGIKEERPTDARETRQADGALLDVDREDVILSDDGWIDETKRAQMTDEELKELELRADERKRVAEAKKNLKEKREEQERKKKEAEEAAAKEKEKAKKKKEEEAPPEEDDDVDEPEPEVEPEPEPSGPVRRAPRSRSGGVADGDSAEAPRTSKERAHRLRRKSPTPVEMPPDDDE